MVRWKRIMILLFLVGCLIIEGKPDAIPVYAAQQDRTDAAGQGLVIDNQNIYEGMDSSYSGGYTPKIQGNTAVVVLPLLSKRKLAKDQLTVSLKFEESENLPFVYKNYEKAVSLGTHETGNKKSECYLVTFSLELKKERYNGSYPVVLSAAAEDESGGDLSRDFTVYVTIADGKQAEGDGKQAASGTGNTEGFVIDNKNIYRGMESSYSAGYTPKIKNNTAVIVLPLLAKRKLFRNRMTVSLKFGESENLPFVNKNYERSVRFKTHTAGNRRLGCYLASFRLKLKKERYNGSYPVILSAAAEDEAGNEINQEFTVYVTVTDGKKTAGAADGGGTDEKIPQFAPKIMISSCRFSQDKVLCGEETAADITLLNTSRTDIIKNMLVTVEADENVELLGRTDGSYVGKLGVGGKCKLSFRFRVKAAAPCGQYNIIIKMDYADGKGNAYTAEGKVNVPAEQKAEVAIDQVSMPKNIKMGETVEMQAQVMNMGKGTIYNVRAIVEADGLASSGSAFIGDIEAGTAMTGSVELTAQGLSGDSLYGTAQGKITFYYEDEMGNEMAQEQDFETSILSPLSPDMDEKPADDSGHWWMVMAVIVGFLAAASVMFFGRKAELSRR